MKLHQIFHFGFQLHKCLLIIRFDSASSDFANLIKDSFDLFVKKAFAVIRKWLQMPSVMELVGHGAWKRDEENPGVEDGGVRRRRRDGCFPFGAATVVRSGDEDVV